MNTIQVKGVNYVPSGPYSHKAVEKLCKKLIECTGGQMSKVQLMSSGSEATEAAIKFALQYYYNKDNNTTLQKLFLVFPRITP